MKHARGRRQGKRVGHPAHNSRIEIRQVTLLDVAGRGMRTEFGGRDVLEDLDVAACDATVPARGTSSREDDQPALGDLVRGHDPPKEWNPVENFVPDLRTPWADDDRSIAVECSFEIAFDFPLALPDGPLVAHVARARAPAR